MIAFTCPCCHALYASLAGLLAHRLPGGSLSTPCRVRDDGLTPCVLSLASAPIYSHLCPPVPLTGVQDSAGPVLACARVVAE